MASIWTPPKSWVPGAQASSSELNTYLRDNTDYLIGPRTWTGVTFANGWHDYGATIAPAQYRIQDQRIWFRGLCRNSAGNAATNFGYALSVFTIPGLTLSYSQFLTALGFTAGVYTGIIVEFFVGTPVTMSIGAAGPGAPVPGGDSWVSLEGLYVDTGT
jgi:hypothetical protein